MSELDNVLAMQLSLLTLFFKNRISELPFFFLG